MSRLLSVIVDGFRSWQKPNPAQVFGADYPPNETPEEKKRREFYELGQKEIAFCQEVNREFGRYVETAVINKLLGDAEELILLNVPAQVVDETTTLALYEMAKTFGVKL